MTDFQLVLNAPDIFNKNLVAVDDHFLLFFPLRVGSLVERDHATRRLVLVDESNIGFNRLF